VQRFIGHWPVSQGDFILEQEWVGSISIPVIGLATPENYRFKIEYDIFNLICDSHG
jgi:hypothetical protein